MKISCQWLEEMIETPLDSKELATQLTQIGLEVKAVHRSARALSKIVAACVRHIAPHPDADHLQVCQVDVGQRQLLQAVCEANHVTVNSYVPVALVGGSIGESTIRSTKINGVQSDGVLCSARELGIKNDTESLLVLGDDIAIGTDIVSYLQLNDTIIELDLTPNRADCLSMVGVAREVAALKNIPLKILQSDAMEITHDKKLPVKVLAVQACPRYLGCVVTGLDTSARPPLWLNSRLERCSIALVSPIVDVMNYVMLELGQPLHAFDLRKLDGGISVRFAHEQEAIHLLDGKDVNLNKDTLVIADNIGAVAIAGIMGDKRSAIGDDTTEVFIECAYFSDSAISGRAQSYGLHTQASHRFERGVDFMLQRQALYRACTLLSQICGGEYGEISEVATESKLPQRAPINLDYAAIEACLGVTIDRRQVTTILNNLNICLKPNRRGWICTPPSYRFDLEIEEDLIEEIGRFYGYDNIPSHRSMPVPIEFNVAKDNASARLKKWCDRLVAYGYHEVVTYSFTNPELLSAAGLPSDLRLNNPISPELSALRPSLLPNLLQTLTYNLNRQKSRLKIFEFGCRFWQKNNEAPQQTSVIAGLVYGAAVPEQWAQAPSPHDFYDVKNDVENLLAGLISQGRTIRYAACEDHPLLHPKLSAWVLLDDMKIACLGALNPKLEAVFDVPRHVSLFELQVEKIPVDIPVVYQPFSRYPLVRRDLSVILAREITISEVLDAIEALKLNALRELIVFDVYTGGNMEANLKSISLGLIFQKFFSTLSDKESKNYTNRVLERLKQKFDAQLRS